MSSCGGSMMKASLNPLAHLVDGVAARWLVRDELTAEQRALIRDEILRAFRIGDRTELTFHGGRYALTIRQDAAEPGGHSIIARELPPEARR